MIGSKVPTFPHLTKTSHFTRMNYQVQRWVTRIAESKLNIETAVGYDSRLF